MKLLELEYAPDANWYETVKSTASPTLVIASAWVGNTTCYVAKSCLCILSIQLPNGNGNSKFSLAWTKQMSSQRNTASSPQPKNARQVKSNVKTMLIAFFDIGGLVHQECVPRGQTVSKEFYKTVLQRCAQTSP